MFTIKKILHKQKGFTLIEVLASLTILSIMVIGFLPIINSSLQQVITAGERSQKLFQAENTMEVSIVDEIVFKGAEIPIFMEDEGEFYIKGGIVEADQLQTFLPWIPTITLEPNIIDEGYPPSAVTINVTGENANFQDRSSTISLSNNKGYSHSTNLTVKNNKKATFKLPREINRLTNANGEYIVSITTGNEVVRAKLRVRLPRFVTIVGNTLKGSKRIEVSTDILAGEVSLKDAGRIKRVFWEDNRFFALGKHKSSEEGLIYVLEEGRTWDKKATGVNNSLNSLAYNGKRFVVVGDQGTIITSTSGDSWTKVSSNNLPVEVSNSNLNAVTWGNMLKDDGTTEEYFIAVGEKYIDIPEEGFEPNHDFGIIIVSKDGLNWEKVNYPIMSMEGEISIDDGDYKSLNNISYGNNKFIAIGEKGSIFTITKDRGNWEITTPEIYSTNNLNGITFSQENNKFIIIGDQGTILVSTDISENHWTTPYISGVNKKNNLLDVIYIQMEDGGKFVAVGEEVVATSSDGMDWHSVSTENIQGSIASRY